MIDATTQSIEARITAYLSAGGLFNPELMQHEKVRDLLLDCRERIAHYAEQSVAPPGVRCVKCGHFAGDRE